MSSFDDRQRPTAGFLRGIDRAAFAVGLADCDCARPVSTSICRAPAPFASALAVQPPATRSELYWLARISLTHRHGDLDLVRPGVRRGVRRHAPACLTRTAGATQRLLPGAGSDDQFAPLPRGRDDIADGGGLPWATLPPVTGTGDDVESSLTVPERLPSNLAGLADTPFEQLSARRARPAGRVARDCLYQLAGPPHPTAAACGGRALRRPARHNGALAPKWLGAGARGAHSARVPAAAGRDGVRREPVDAGTCRGVHAPDACCGAVRRRRGVRLCYQPDAAHLGLGASVGGGRDRARRPPRSSIVSVGLALRRTSTRSCDRGMAACSAVPWS